jgi:hypothetical protein
MFEYLYSNFIAMKVASRVMEELGAWITAAFFIYAGIKFAQLLF